MRARSLKSSQILRAHMPYFRRPGHIYKWYIFIFLDSCTPSGHFVWALATPQSYAITENSSGVKAPCLTIQTLTSHLHFLFSILIRGKQLVSVTLM